MMRMENYSVLMSVYYKEKAAFLQESMESIYKQTIPTNDFVLVCDGPLGEELNFVIEKMQVYFGDILHIVRLKKNCGLGNALNEGLKHCKNELVARMDSDDISFPDRCERQLTYFEKKQVSIVSGTVLEFAEDISEITGKRKVPSSHEEICKFSKKRNPFNHPTVMFRKREVEKAGGYSEKYPLFEDYYLWVRMLQNGSIGQNIEEPLLYMRTPRDMYMRRGGKRYAKNMLRFHGWLCEIKWSSVVDYLSGAVPHAVVCVLPNGVRKRVYMFLH